MCSAMVNIPDEVLYDTKMSKTEANDFAKKAVALMMYKKNKVSIGYCAKIAEMNKEDFIKFLGDNGVSIFSFESEDEFLKEMNNA
ncbi:UPF0175 family protein [Pseudobutyrivibrio sp.]|uniref:UPF0175 family protein n=1 Tax=Pseudobutyrivibrio sp. TaxID=2014367 RepID=UPI001DF302BC|nr:UPF0175 family protein [Pseudobutyrivibrio sp.]MBE5910154.1 UPF0175 family protein [Pseudobutyrivibrio sp.]